MYSTYNERKSVFAERFIRTLRNKIYKHMTAVPKNVYLDVIDDIVDKLKMKTIKMKPIDVKPDFYAECNGKSNAKNHKFQVRDHVRISKYKKIFANGYAPNWSEEVLLLAKLRIQFHGHTSLMI